MDRIGRAAMGEAPLRKLHHQFRTAAPGGPWGATSCTRARWRGCAARLHTPHHCRAPNRSAQHPTGMPPRSAARATPPSGAQSLQTREVVVGCARKPGALIRVSPSIGLERMLMTYGPGPKACARQGCRKNERPNERASAARSIPIEPVSVMPKRKLEDGEQRLAPRSR